MVRRGTAPFALALVLGLPACVGCGRDGVLGGGVGDPHIPLPQMSPPPGSGPLAFVTLQSPEDTVEAGQYGVPVIAGLTNQGAQTASGVRVALTYRDGNGSRDPDFVTRELAWVGEVGPGASVDVGLVVDVSPGLDVEEDIVVSGTVLYTTGGVPFAAPSREDLPWDVANIEELVVDTIADAVPDPFLSLREAIAAAVADGDRTRIRFDSTIFPEGTPSTILIDAELPPIDGVELIIDGTGAGVILEPLATRYGSEQWLLRVRDDVVVHRLTLRKGGELYPVFDLTGNGCAGGEQDGGAILAEGANAVLTVDRVTFDDVGVQRRNCFAPIVRIATGGGAGHRIVDSEFLSPPGDAILARAPTVEISRNRVTGARDDGIFVYEPSGATRISGNVVSDVTLAGILVAGAAGAPLDISHNTVLRCGWAFRSFDARPMSFRNNAVLDSTMYAFRLAGAGSGTSISHTQVEGGTLCDPGDGACASATRDFATITTSGDLLLSEEAGTTFTDIVPLPGSPLIDAATFLHDVNGRLPGLYSGAAPDIGAAERP